MKKKLIHLESSSKSIFSIWFQRNECLKYLKIVFGIFNLVALAKNSLQIISFLKFVVFLLTVIESIKHSWQFEFDHFWVWSPAKASKGLKTRTEIPRAWEPQNARANFAKSLFLTFLFKFLLILFALFIFVFHSFLHRIPPSFSHQQMNDIICSQIKWHILAKLLI